MAKKKVIGRSEYTSRHWCVVVLSCHRYIKGTKLISIFLIKSELFLFLFFLKCCL